MQLFSSQKSQVTEPDFVSTNYFAILQTSAAVQKYQAKMLRYILVMMTACEEECIDSVGNPLSIFSIIHIPGCFSV